MSGSVKATTRWSPSGPKASSTAASHLGSEPLSPPLRDDCPAGLDLVAATDVSALEAAPSHHLRGGAIPKQPLAEPVVRPVLVLGLQPPDHLVLRPRPPVRFDPSRDSGVEDQAQELVAMLGTQTLTDQP